MGYAGYAPGFRTVELSDLEKLLKTIEHDECLATLKKVISNTAQAPTEAKFRKLKLTTPKVKELIVDVPGAVESLLQFGWVQELEDGQPVLVLPPTVHLTMLNVRTVEDTITRLAAKRADETRAARAKAKAPLDPERERIRAQMEADRKERAARGPVTQGSVAQALPTNGAAGPATIFGGGGGEGAGSSGAPGGGGGGGHGGGGRVRCVHSMADWSAAHAEAKAGKKALIVDFTATWCGPCKMIAPVFAQLSEKYKNTIFIKVDVDEAREVAASCSVSSMPTFHAYKGGQKVAEMVGADPTRLEQLVKQAESA